ncbi:hypothetical protein MBLNU457_4314t2 [Dothideomycetes sp. NU457]
MHDPLLTPFGEEQCRTLSKEFPYNDKIDLVVASPLKRTIYTALNSFPGPIQNRHLKVIALPELQETSDLPCDTGSDAAEVQREFQGKPVDLAKLQGPEGATWNSKQGKWAPNSDAIQGRAQEARQWLLQRPEKDIVVVTHGGFLHYFTEDWAGHDKFQGSHHHEHHHLHLHQHSEKFRPHHHMGEIDLFLNELLNDHRAGTGWANTEFRSYTFAPEGGAHLIETPESRQRRAGTEKPLSKEEQKNLARTTSDKSNDDSYQKAQAIQSKV